jgi:hypothetical protein
MQPHSSTTPFGRRSLRLAHVASQAVAKARRPEKAVLFPSNQQLALRAHGMAPAALSLRLIGDLSPLVAIAPAQRDPLPYEF